jgi:hypothetical protein
MKTNNSVGKVGMVTLLLTTLTGCTTYVMQRPEPQAVYVPPPAYQSAEPVAEPPPVYEPPAPAAPDATPVVVIRSDDDFYQPLSPYGQWVTVDGYGRCWQPGQVEPGWRPYANGHWELTDAGWYWESDEPWGWATYHYGRWELAPNYGWVWVPQTEWAPAWVSWREGGGYVGWAPLPPEPRAGVSVNVVIAPAAFCFVEERRMHEPVRPSTVIVNNTTIINKTVVITKTKVVNKRVINEGPRADEVERASGHRLQAVSLNELRHKDEEPVAEKHRNLQARPEPRQQPAVQHQPEPQREVRPRELPNRDNGNPQPAPVVQPAPRESEKPVRNERAPKPQRQVEPRPTPPGHETQPANNGNNREQPLREQNPAPREVRPAERPVEQARPDVNTREQQPARPQPEVHPAPQPARERVTNKPEKQKNVPATQKGKNAPKAKARGREAGGTNANDNAAPGR